MGGRIWAQPEVTARQMRAVKAQANARLQGKTPGSAPQDLIASVSIAGPMGPEPASLLRTTMRIIGEGMQMNLEEVGPDQIQSRGHWHMQTDAVTGLPSGIIKVQLGSSSEAGKMIRTFHQTPITVGEEVAMVRIQNDMITTLPGNVGGAPLGSRVAAPTGLA